VPITWTYFRDVTGVVVRVNVAEFVPAGITILVGGETSSDGSYGYVSPTVVPPVGAFPVSVTVMFSVPPPFTDEVAATTDASAGGLTLSATVLITVPKVNWMLAELTAATGYVVIGNVMLDCPAGTVTVSLGTVATGVLRLCIWNTAPGPCAARSSFMVAVDAVPPSTDEGAKEIHASAGALAVTLAPVVSVP
jgi:hypothetical protein